MFNNSINGLTYFHNEVSNLNNNNVEQEIKEDDFSNNEDQSLGTLELVIPEDNENIVNPLRINDDIKNELEDTLVLCYSGLNHDSNIIHKDFTCQVENDLDLISQGKAEWIEVIRKVYLSFYEIRI